MRTLVIGSNSFSGQDFLDYLLDETDDEILAVSRGRQTPDFQRAWSGRADAGRVHFRRLCICRDADELLSLAAEFKPHWIVNFASQSEVAPSWEFPEQWFDTNATAVARLANAWRQVDWLDRYLHVSTPEVYGDCVGMVGENAPFRPSTPYAASRAAGEMMLDVLHRSWGFPVVKVRAANVFGARQQLFKIIPRSGLFVRLGRRIPLHGGGSSRRSFIHIRDVSRAELAVLRTGTVGDAYNLATPEIRTIAEVVKMVCDVSGVSFDKITDVVESRVGHDSAYLLDCTKARDELGWVPEIGFEDGVRETMTWIDRNLDQLKNLPLEYIHRR